MDPKTLPNLDPKLREVYERVMKTPITPPSPTSNIQPPPPASPSLGGPPPTPQPPVSVPANNEPSPVPSAKPPVAQLSPTPQNTFHSTQVFNPDTAVPPSTTSPSTDTAAPKSKGKISPVVLVLVGVVFFAIYAVVWISFFKVSLPF
ncbi:MAG: hypothetical protein Q7S38_00585 [bacterium]|nr:hypothetical protein [bacterium]